MAPNNTLPQRVLVATVVPGAVPLGTAPDVLAQEISTATDLPVTSATAAVAGATTTAAPKKKDEVRPVDNPALVVDKDYELIVWNITSQTNKVKRDMLKTLQSKDVKDELELGKFHGIRASDSTTHDNLPDLLARFALAYPELHRIWKTRCMVMDLFAPKQVIPPVRNPTGAAAAGNAQAAGKRASAAPASARTHAVKSLKTVTIELDEADVDYDDEDGEIIALREACAEAARVAVTFARSQYAATATDEDIDAIAAEAVTTLTEQQPQSEPRRFTLDRDNLVNLVLRSFPPGRTTAGRGDIIARIAHMLIDKDLDMSVYITGCAGSDRRLIDARGKRTLDMWDP